MELYPKYEVSTEGHIRNSVTHHIYSQRLRTDGYLDFNFWFEGKKTQKLVHRMVATCYLDNPLKLPEVNHKNKIKTDNRVENLEWVSRQQNIEHRNADSKIQNKMKERGMCLAKLNLETKAKPVSCYDLEGNLVMSYPSLISAERETGINRKYIRACLNGERQTAGKMFWKANIVSSTAIPKMEVESSDSKQKLAQSGE